MPADRPYVRRTSRHQNCAGAGRGVARRLAPDAMSNATKRFFATIQIDQQTLTNTLASIFGIVVEAGRARSLMNSPTITKQVNIAGSTVLAHSVCKVREHHTTPT